MSSRSTTSSTRNRRSNRPIRIARRRRRPEPRVVGFSPKESYKTKTTDSGLLMLSKRKNVFLTDEEKQETTDAKLQKTLQIKKKKLGVFLLRHKVTALWEQGAWLLHVWMDFWGKNCKKIIEFVQSTYPQYAQFATARSFVYRAIKRHKLGLTAGDGSDVRSARWKQTIDKAGKYRDCWDLWPDFQWGQNHLSQSPPNAFWQGIFRFNENNSTHM